MFYSGDLRAHGRKAVLFEELVKNPPGAIDILLLEGTTFSRRDGAIAPERRNILSSISFYSAASPITGCTVGGHGQHRRA